MIGIFAYAFNAVAPILLLVLLGYYLREQGKFSQDFFKKANKLAFHYCFPPLMFSNLYTLNSIRDVDVTLAVYLIGSVIILTILGFLVANVATKVRNRKGVLIQAGFRSNFAIIGLPLAEGLLGPEGGALAASMQAPTIIYFNIVSVLALCIYSENARFDLKKILKNLMKNPLIQGLLAGLVALILREFIPRNGQGELVFSIEGSLPWLYTVIRYLGRMATPMCLIALGGQFNFSDAPAIRRELITGVLMRLVIAPLLGFSMAFACDYLGWITMSPAYVGIMVAAYGSPIAVSSAVMASEMGGDDVLASQIVVWTSMLSMITVFFMAVVFRAAGLL